MPSIYAFDPTGLASANKIVGEVHTLTEINANPYRLIIPGFAPFYLDNFKLSYIDSLGAVQALDEGIDFHLTLPYIAATRSIGKMVYGGISISNLQLNGTYKVDYQTIGGDWVCDVPSVFQALVNNNYNPKIASWDSVTNVQAIFPPINHEVHMDQLKGHEDLIASLGSLADTIANKPQTMWPLPASQAQVNTGLDNNTYVTPLTLKNAVGLGGGGTGGSGSIPPHTHAEIDVVGLINDLANKSDTGHHHAINEIASLQTSLDTKAALVHSHSSLDITGLDTLLSTKANSTHTHNAADINGLQAIVNSLQAQIDTINNALITKANASHTHTKADITDLGSLSSSLGLNVFTNMTGQYPFGVDIVNDKGDMLIAIHGGLYSNHSIYLYLDGILANSMGNATGAYISGNMFAFIPAGRTFKISLISGAGAPNINIWTKDPITVSNTILETFDNAALAGWIINQNLNGGTGATATTSGGYLVPNSFGTGTSWHGPRVTKQFPSVGDFDITFQDFNFTNVASDMGNVDLCIGSSSKPYMFYFTMNDAWDNSTAGLEGYTFTGSDNTQTNVSSTKTSTETLTAANIRLTRTGSVFKGYLDGVEKFSMTCDTTPVTEINIQFGKYVNYNVNQQSLGGVSGTLSYL